MNLVGACSCGQIQTSREDVSCRWRGCPDLPLKEGEEQLGGPGDPWGPERSLCLQDAGWARRQRKRGGRNGQPFVQNIVRGLLLEQGPGLEKPTDSVIL